MFEDGTVVPSGFSPKGHGLWGDMGQLDDLRIRVGEVKEIIYPSDPRSVSKSVTEYRVMTSRRDSHGQSVYTLYGNCPVASLFGGSADSVRFTLRADTSGKAGPGNGSKVVLACLNGQATAALIIAGDPADSAPDQKTNGHCLSFSFNGIDIGINDAGEFSMRFSGPTNPDGSLRQGAQASDSGTRISMTKDGNLTIGHDTEHLEFDHQNKVVTLQADQDINIDSLHGPLKVHTDQEIHMESTNKGLTLKSPDNQVFDTTAGVLIGSPNAKQALILGTWFRADLSTQNQSLMSAILQALIAVTTAQALCSAIGVAIVVPIAGAIATAPMHAALAVQLGLIGQALNRMGAAFQQMESVSTRHTSSKNFSDS